MGRVLRFPLLTADVTRAVERVTAELERDRTVIDAFDAVERGDFDAQAVRDVIRGHAGTWDEFFALNELMKLVGRVRYACGFRPEPRRCSCTTRCASWPHCPGGPEGI
jgi:hypothetical protein